MTITNRKDIRVGDIVTYQYIEDGALVTKTEEVVAVQPLYFRTVGDAALYRGPSHSTYAVINIERPEPPLPPEPGTVIDANIKAVDGTYRLLRTDRDQGYWVTATQAPVGIRWFEDSYIESWTLVASA